MTSFVPSPEQAAIINAPLRSLRVSAGAGTGKTATIAARVAALVTTRGIEPEAVIGLTFTNKAAEELSDRIRHHLGGSPDHSVEVVTYHGFAALLLREHGLHVGVERGSRILTPAYARQLVGRLLASAELDHFDPTSPTAIDAVLRLAGETAENLLAPSTVPADDSAAGAARAEILSIIAAYETEKRRLGMVDFGDLVFRAHELVTTRPDVADSVRRRYRAVVLDEYQDTSPAQRELLRALFAGRVPVLAVGDADQTIYEWRGASIENFEAFPEHFADDDGPAPTSPLTLNRRSGSAVLAVANDVRRRIDDRPRPDLVPLPDTAPGRVVSRWLDTAAAEADWIARRIVALHDNGRPWGDVAVLFRKNKDMALVHEALARHDVPFEVANLGGLLSVPEVVDVCSWLRVVGHPEDGAALVRILLGSRYRLGLGDLAALSRWSRGTAGDGEDPVSLVEVLDHLDEVSLRDGASAALRRFRTEYRLLLEKAQASSVSELARSVLDVTGAWSDVDAMEPTASLTARLNLYRFLDLAEEWSPLEGRPSLGAFISFLAALDNDTEAPDAARLSGADAVVLLTVHRAKGLEWPVVFLPAVYQGNFPASGSVSDPATRPAALPFELRLDAGTLPGPDLDRKERKRALDERARRQEWRTAYVATTRPREELYVTGAWWYGHPEPNKKPSQPSELFKLVAGHGESVVGQPPPRPEMPIPVPGAAPDPLFAGSWPAALAAALDDPTWPATVADGLGVSEAFETALENDAQTFASLPPRTEPAPPVVAEASATGLVTYATCPRRYYWSAVDRLPRRFSPAARRGVDVHRRIELHNLGIAAFGEIDESFDAGPAAATAAPAGGTDPFTVYSSSRFAAERPILVEAPFEIPLGRLTVRGKVDAIYRKGAGNEEIWEIVDYKSGSPSTDPAKVVQLEVYAVAAVGGAFPPHPPPALEATFAYLGGGRLVEESHVVDEPWLDRAKERLAELAAGITAGRWEPRPSPACGSCDFLRFCEAGRSAGFTPPGGR